MNKTMTKKKEPSEKKKPGRKTKAEKEEMLKIAETAHKDVVETKAALKETEEERAERRRKQREKEKLQWLGMRDIENDMERAERLGAQHNVDPKVFMSAEARVTLERRKRQAQALWEMYYSGELYLQTLAIPSIGGARLKSVLYSHKSTLAV